MRICIFLTPVEYGGGERQILLLGEEFRKLGVVPRLVCLAKSEAFEKEAARRDIPLLRVASTGLGFSPSLRRYCLHLIRILPSVLFDYRVKKEISSAEVLWARGFPASAFLVLAVSMLRPKSVKMVYSHHWEKRPAGGFLRWIQLKLLSRFDAIVGVSALVAETLKTVFPELAGKIVAIPNGIEVTKFQIEKSKIQMRKDLGLPSEAVIAVYAARFAPPKNHLFLLEVLKKCRNAALRLLLLGEGSELKPFMEHARQENLLGRILHRGFVQPNEVPRYLAASDLCVFPSLGEGFSNAILEAMAAGLPIVMFKKIWSEEYGQHVIAASTPEEFIAAVNRLAGDPRWAAELGKRVREDVRSLDIGAIARRYGELFSKV
jgi:glycosyltransferase involved in cell wall biosynthesis